jgi:beta-galactosidase
VKPAAYLVAVSLVLPLWHCGAQGDTAEAGAGLDASGELSDGPGGPGDVGPSSSSSGSGADAKSGSSGGTSDAATDASLPDTGVTVPSSPRTRTQLASWRFLASDTLTGAEVPTFEDSAWAVVSVPHTWDSVTQVTKHTNSWYRAHVNVAAADAQKSFFVYFEGAFQVADVYVNGHHLGQHRGGFTHFVFDASHAIQVGDNVVAVQVSNADCADCLPDGNARLYKGYGGIYRKAWWIATSPYHVATTDYASSGLYVSPSAPAGSVSADVLVSNDSAADQTFTVRSVVEDASGNAVVTSQSDVLVKAGTTQRVTHTGTVSSPHLWGPSDPYLYGFVATVTVGGKVADAVGVSFGFRSYQLTTTDFTLNGASTRLRGMAKHQETEYRADAVSDADLTADWDALQELGVNYVRLVHYPHAELEYDLADQRGIMVWSENGQTNSGPPTPNGDNINREMVYQNWNHPSIVFWSAGNEAGGVAATSEYADVLKATDPSRPVVYASSGQNPTNVDFIFHNTYAGWYGGSMYDFLTASDHWVSETGAGAVIATHTADAFAMNHTVDSFEPEEYGALVNEVRFDDLLRKPAHVPAYSGWVFRDISDVKYKGLLNTKGLLTFAGYKKDIFYHVKSLLRSSPVVRLVGRSYFLRSANGTGEGAVKAYSNAANLTLSVNGTPVGEQSNDRYQHPNGTPIHDVFYWPNALALGKNVLEVDDGAGNTDTVTVYYRGSGTTLPADPGARVTNLTASNGPAYFIDRPVADQLPFYLDFDGTGDNWARTVAGSTMSSNGRMNVLVSRVHIWGYPLPAVKPFDRIWVQIVFVVAMFGSLRICMARLTFALQLVGASAPASAGLASAAEASWSALDAKTQPSSKELTSKMHAPRPLSS